MQWLEQGNDHCAYCRKDMMTPAEMVQAAREKLGHARVDKITHINEMAAQRLEEYQAALAAGADNNRVNQQFASGTMPGDQGRLWSGNSVDDDDDDNNNVNDQNHHNQNENDIITVVDV
jgi:hypothetical protein